MRLTVDMNGRASASQAIITSPIRKIVPFQWKNIRPIFSIVCIFKKSFNSSWYTVIAFMNRNVFWKQTHYLFISKNGLICLSLYEIKYLIANSQSENLFFHKYYNANFCLHRSCRQLLHSLLGHYHYQIWIHNIHISTTTITSSNNK